MQKVKDRVAGTPYEKAAMGMKIMQFFNAALLIITGIVHFVYFKKLKSFNGFVLTIYLFLFAAIFILLELSKLRMRIWFYFMNFGWGKAIFLTFVGLLLMGAGKTVTWIDILAGVWLFLCAIAFAVISSVHKEVENDFVKDLIENGDNAAE